MKTWDAIIVGGGIIGLSLARELHKNGLQVLLLERGEPGHEASHAAAGMLAASEANDALREIATASANLYPEFVREVEDESGARVDLRDQGAICVTDDRERLDSIARPLPELEPNLVGQDRSAIFVNERSVDPRALTAALWKAAKSREIDISSGAEVTELLTQGDRVCGVRTNKAAYPGHVVVNCAGAWAGTVAPCMFPTRPVKGQMLCLVGKPVLRHVIRTPEVYLVPRTDGRILVGSTAEEVGFDKRVDADTIHRLHRSAVALVPALADHRIHSSWAGLRPGTPDGLPILGAADIPGYFAATGHFRDGILLAPITAHLLAQVITGKQTDYDLSAFEPLRFATTRTMRSASAIL